MSNFWDRVSSSFARNGVWDQTAPEHQRNGGFDGAMTDNIIVITTAPVSETDSHPGIQIIAAFSNAPASMAARQLNPVIVNKRGPSTAMIQRNCKDLSRRFG